MNDMDLTKGLTPSGVKQVEIGIETAYQWGIGWTSRDARQFEKEVYPKLEEAGYTIIPDKYATSAPSLLKENDAVTNLYLHPLKFSGYAYQEDIDAICDILKTCSTVKEVREPFCQDTYDITNEEYAQILTEHEDEIREYYGYLKEVGGALENCFIKNYRIPRIGDHTGLISSDDFEFKWLHDWKERNEA